jgi:hypothetical protein
VGSAFSRYVARGCYTRPKEPLINVFFERIAALRGTRNLVYLYDMPRLLRSVRLALHLGKPVFQGFPKVHHGGDGGLRGMKMGILVFH